MDQGKKDEGRGGGAAAAAPAPPAVVRQAKTREGVTTQALGEAQAALAAAEQAARVALGSWPVQGALLETPLAQAALAAKQAVDAAKQADDAAKKEVGEAKDQTSYATVKDIKELLGGFMEDMSTRMGQLERKVDDVERMLRSAVLYGDGKTHTTLVAAPPPPPAWSQRGSPRQQHIQAEGYKPFR